jgi:RNA polymerase sigma-70 factor (ECF subfamily)
MASEDIVSESIIQLWHAMRRDTVTSPRSFLVAILKNNALNYLKHLSIRQAGLETMSESSRRDTQYRIMSLEACDPQEMFSKEITEIIERTLMSLPEQTRRIFEMSRYEQRQVREIAEAFSITPKAVEYHITKALKLLRVSLREYLPLLLLVLEP